MISFLLTFYRTGYLSFLLYVIYRCRFSLFICSYLLSCVGDDIVAVDSPIGRLGLTVCYDLRFPELYQQLRFHQNAQV